MPVLMEGVVAHATPTTPGRRTHPPLISPHREWRLHNPESRPHGPTVLGKRLPAVECEHSYRQLPDTTGT